MTASVLMQLALGGVYAWSAFVPALREHHALAGWQAGLFCGTFGGLLAIGHLKPMALAAGLSSQAGALAVAGFAAGNAVGRIVWGMVHDRVGSHLVPIGMGFLGFFLLGLLESGSGWRFVTASVVVGFGFGSCFVLYAAETAAVFGVSRVPRVYPQIFLAYGVAGISGPFLGGWLYDLTGADGGGGGRERGTDPPSPGATGGGRRRGGSLTNGPDPGHGLLPVPV